MPGAVPTDLLADWCTPGADAPHQGAGLHRAVNAAWEAHHGGAPASLLRALAADEESRLDRLVDRALRPGTPGSPLVTELHRTFVTDVDPARERAACRPDLDALAAVGDDAGLLELLADLTRTGCASPLHVDVRGDALVVPQLHPAPLPPADFDDTDRRAAYATHMSAMVGHIGGALPAHRLDAVLDLDRALWTGPAPGPAEPGFPWVAFLHRVVGPRARAWRSGVTRHLAGRMATWWAAPLEHRRDWMITRLAYDLGPFASEEALVRNSRFFAGRVLGVHTPRSRPERFVSFVRTVAPDTLSALYVADRHDSAVLDRARDIAEAVRLEAVAWATEIGDPSAADALNGVVVELGSAPDPPAPGDGAGEGVSGTRTVCGTVRAARGAAVSRRLALLDTPVERGWRIEPYTAAAYYQASTHRVVFPWALLREPVLGAGTTPIRDHAVFGTLVAHEMAHAVLPGDPGDWPDFIRRTGLRGVLGALRSATAGPDGAPPPRTHERELAADALGLRWAWRAHRTVTSETDTRSSFLAHWATRWRGGRATRHGGFAHLDRHPPAELRCDLAPGYLDDPIVPWAPVPVGLARWPDAAARHTATHHDADAPTPTPKGAGA